MHTGRTERALKCQEVSRIAQSSVSQAASQDTASWLGGQSLMLMEAGGLNVKAEPEGTHKEGTRVQRIPGRVIRGGGSRRARPRCRWHGGRGRLREGGPRQVIAIREK